MKIQYRGYLDHSVMFDEEYIFKGSKDDINNQYKIYDIPDQAGRFLCKHYPEDEKVANVKGMIFKEIKKK